MKREITELIEDCLQFFRANRYAETTLGQYQRNWRRGILQYMKEKGETIYTPKLGADFIRERFSETDRRPTAREMVRNIRVLDDYLNMGYIRDKQVVPVTYSLHGEIGIQMQKLITQLQAMRKSPITVDSYKRNLNRFLGYLNNAGVYSINEISESHIIKFISTIENCKVNTVSYLRVLFRFWYENHLSEENYVEILNNYRWRKREKIPSYYSPDEINLIESSADRFNGIDKRNYAMLLLASRLGLRASDIANLKFSNINWDQNEISLTQYKTGNPIKLPLLSDVGNAIIDYLQHGRLKSDSQHIFLAHKPPYNSANSSIACGAIRKIINHSGILIESRHHCPHSLRHSLASNLLNSGTPIPVITAVLGHEHTDSTMTYLRIDITSLKQCALPVPLVNDAFYTQKGGVFYE